MTSSSSATLAQHLSILNVNVNVNASVSASPNVNVVNEVRRKSMDKKKMKSKCKTITKKEHTNYKYDEAKCQNVPLHDSGMPAASLILSLCSHTKR